MATKPTASEAKTIAGIENRLGPVGKGHHNSHRTQALMDWLRAKEGQKKSDPKAASSAPQKKDNKSAAPAKKTDQKAPPAFLTKK